MVYGPGEFSYGDYLPGGGKAATDTTLLKGFKPGQWGLNLPAGARGQAVWRFTAQEGSVFKDATLWSVSVSGRDNAIEIRTPGSGNNYATISKDREVQTDEEFDIGEHVAGSPWFEIRFSARNNGKQAILCLTSFTIKGRVAKKKMPRSKDAQ